MLAESRAVSDRSNAAVSASFRRILTFTALPFAAWIAGLFTIGNWLSDLVGIKEGTDIGIIGVTLDRLCVPGTVLIAALSGGAAVNSAWEAFIWRERFRRCVGVTGRDKFFR